MKGFPKLTANDRKSLELSFLNEAQRLAPDPPPLPGRVRVGLLRVNCAGIVDYTQVTVSQGWISGIGSGTPFPLGWSGKALLGPRELEGTHIAGQLLVVFHELLILLVDS